MSHLLAKVAKDREWIKDKQRLDKSKLGEFQPVKILKNWLPHSRSPIDAYWANLGFSNQMSNDILERIFERQRSFVSLLR